VKGAYAYPILAAAAVMALMIAAKLSRRKKPEGRLANLRHGVEGALDEAEHRAEEMRVRAQKLKGDAQKRMQEQARELEAREQEIKVKLDELKTEASKLLERARP
jgi:hypothetical protein